MSQTQIAPISAAKHYATSSEFWEGRAKVLQHHLDEANDMAAKLRTIITNGSPEELADAKAKMLAAETPAATE